MLLKKLFIKRIHTSDHIIGGTLLLTLGWNSACSLFSPGWVAAFMIVGINWLIFMTYYFIRRDYFFGQIMLVALVAGWVELLADWWLASKTGTLVYHLGGPFVLRSPLYMPFAWGVVLIQAAYVGWRSSELFGLRTAVLLTGMLGAGTIPFYEWWAKGAGWWYYRLAPMWGAIPFYIILGEFLIASGLILVVNCMKERPSWMVSLFGIAQGLWIWGCYIIAFVRIG